MDYNSMANGTWQGEDYHLQKRMNNEEPQSLYNEVPMNKEDQSYMFDVTTPVKACRDFTYDVNCTENFEKESEEWREPSSQLKRRRMLQFDTEIISSPLCNEEMPSVFLKSNAREESMQEAIAQSSELLTAFEDLSASGFESLDESSDWLAQCLNDTDIDLSCSDDMNLPGISDLQIDISEFCCNEVPAPDVTPVQTPTTRSLPNVVFRGMKSLIATPTKLASSITQPFGIVKPCAFQGDVTLKDINQLIHTPPKSNQNGEDPSLYPTSAFSGKPVVGKTKICTGGKGSITIMRTKG